MSYKKYFFFIAIFVFLPVIIGLSINTAQAVKKYNASKSLFSPIYTEIVDVTYPVSELGNCANKDACKTYCDDLSHKDACSNFVSADKAEQLEKLPPVGPGGCRGEKECRAYCEDSANHEECVAFAEQHGLIKKEEAERFKKFKELDKKGGPGGCRGEAACRAYCENPSRADECLEFAEREGFISKEEIKIARQVLKEGGPGGCRGEACRAYCEDPANIEQCLEFGKKHGLVSEKDANRARLVAQGGPGGCRGEKECRAFCENPANQEECFAFAEKHELIPKEELERAKKFASKTGPGGCRGAECRTYCENPGHQDECLEFAEREGLIPKEELERAKKFIKISKEGGPGGCKGEECRTYCEDPSHSEECFEFAKKNNLISEKEQEHFKRGMELGQKVKESGGPGGCKSEEECRAYCGDPEHVEECIAFGSAHANISPEEAAKMLKEFNRGRHGDEFRPEREFEAMDREQFRKFDEFKQLEHEFRGKSEFMMSSQGEEGEFRQGVGIKEEGVKMQKFIGPGGCSSPQECIKYCAEHREECFSFGPPGKPDVRPGEGGIPPGHEAPRLRMDFVKPMPVPSGASADEFGRCVSEIVSTFDKALLQANPEEYARKKTEAAKICAEKFRGGFPGQPGGVEERREGLSGEQYSGATYPADFEGKCDLGWNLELNPATNRKYCAISQQKCGELHSGTALTKDQSGYSVCWVRAGEEPRPRTKICPAMPTVDQCPEGQKKAVAFSSPECGTYYRCVSEQEGTLTFPSQPPTETKPIFPPPGTGETSFVCPQVFTPVCGTDNHTYSNDCVAKSKGIGVQYQGECKAGFETTPPPTVIPAPLPISDFFGKCLAEKLGIERAGQLLKGAPATADEVRVMDACRQTGGLFQNLKAELLGLFR